MGLSEFSVVERRGRWLWGFIGQRPMSNINRNRNHIGRYI